MQIKCTILITGIVILLLAFAVIACNTTSLNTDLAALTINISSFHSETIISDNVKLQNNSDDSKTHYGQLLLNKITFSGIKKGVYSLFIGSQLIDDSVDVSNSVNNHHLTLDDSFDGIRITVLNNTGQNLHSLNVGSYGIDYLFTKRVQVNNLDEVFLNGSSHTILLQKSSSGNARVSLRYHSNYNIFTKYEMFFEEDSAIVFSRDDLDYFSYIRTYFKWEIFTDINPSDIVPWHNEQGQIQTGNPILDNLMISYDIIGLSRAYIHDECICMGFSEGLGGHYRQMFDLELRNNSKLNEAKTKLNNEPIVIWAYLISEYEKGE